MGRQRQTESQRGAKRKRERGRGSGGGVEERIEKVFLIPLYQHNYQHTAWSGHKWELIDLKINKYLFG